MIEGQEKDGGVEEDRACEDCLSKQLVVERLSALWQSYGERFSMKSAIVDAAHALGVKLDLAR